MSPGAVLGGEGLAGGLCPVGRAQALDLVLGNGDSRSEVEAAGAEIF